MKFLKSMVIVATMLVCVVACKPKNKNEDENGIKTGDNPSIVDCKGKENFVEFYDKFMTDSAFQMERIIFPLEGKPTFVDSTSFKEEYYFTADLWKPHHKIDFKNLPRWHAEWYDFGFMVKEIADNAIDNMFLERRWRNDDGKWFLVYYSDLNKRNRGENEPKLK